MHTTTRAAHGVEINPEELFNMFFQVSLLFRTHVH